MTIDRIRELWATGERDIDRIAFASDTSPEFVRRVVGRDGPRPTRIRPKERGRPPVPELKLTAAEVTDLRAEFAARPPGSSVDAWMRKRADLLGVGHATVRRAVYGFGAYSTAEPDADTCHP